MNIQGKVTAKTKKATKVTLNINRNNNFLYFYNFGIFFDIYNFIFLIKQNNVGFEVLQFLFVVCAIGNYNNFIAD